MYLYKDIYYSLRLLTQKKYGLKTPVFSEVNIKCNFALVLDNTQLQQKLRLKGIYLFLIYMYFMYKRKF